MISTTPINKYYFVRSRYVILLCFLFIELIIFISFENKFLQKKHWFPGAISALALVACNLKRKNLFVWMRKMNSLELKSSRVN
jgi:hypothetical protein